VSSFAELFGGLKPLLGMVHLRPLPGSPSGGSLEDALAAAHSDAQALMDAGFDGLVVENFGDTPFAKENVPPSTVASMAVVAHELRRTHNVPLGVNVLRNDARAALSIASVCGCDFIRVNVHVGAVVADQGVIEGRARETLLLRRELASSVLLFVDVRVKHARPLGSLEDRAQDLVAEAKDAFERAHADALILSGPATGSPTEPGTLRAVKEKLPRAPLLVGSGVSAENLGEFWGVCDGMIVGTSVKRGENPRSEVDPERARSVAARVRDLRRKVEVIGRIRS
jgi:membrane complex biogenesis BtpA family protein